MEIKEVRKGRFSSISPVAVREYYARPVQVNDGIKTSLPMKARPAPIMIVKSPTP